LVTPKQVVVDDEDDADDDVDSGAGNVRLFNHVSARVL